MKEQDRIERAFQIICDEGARFWGGCWYVWSQSSGREYEVKAFNCECPDARVKGKICKHQLASVFQLVTLAAISFRHDATSEQELFQLGIDFAPRLSKLPRAAVTIARNEYQRRLNGFRLGDSVRAA